MMRILPFTLLKEIESRLDEPKGRGEPPMRTYSMKAHSSGAA
jgi:hypothetical protein